MSKIFAVLAVLLILTGGILLAIPREQPATTRGAPNVQQVVSAYTTVRSIAEQVNAPLSILFGLISLFYSRKTYKAQSQHGHGKPGGHA